MLKRAYDPADVERFKQLVEIFRKHGSTYSFDHLMLMAQGYQESQLDQSRRSHRGAVGIMQLLPSTAADKASPGNLRKFRAKAKDMGLDPNLWFGNVENAAAAIVGRETVQYVGNIYKYYIAYSLIAAHDAQTSAAKAEGDGAAATP